MGITGNTNKCIENFLSNWEKRVYLVGAISSPVKVESTVSQGAVLSGLLFLLFINYLSKLSKTCSASVYADDA